MKVGDLVKHPPLFRNSEEIIGIVVKKNYQTQKIKGEKHTKLTYDVLASDGEVLKNLNYTRLSIVQELN